jgi:hypothetical protein
MRQAAAGFAAALLVWSTAAAQTSGSSPPAGSPAGLHDRGAPIDVSGFAYQRKVLDGPPGLVLLPLDAAALAHSQGPLRTFADVRIVDDQDVQVPYVLEQRPARLTMEVQVRKTVPRVREFTTRKGLTPIARSFYAITLPYENLPQPSLVLETSEAIFLRVLELGVQRSADRRHRDDWFEPVAKASWQHADPRKPASPIEISFQRQPVRELMLVVEEGDNRPLPITGSRLLLPGWQLRFFHTGTPLRLIYGRNEATEPRYDVAMLAPSEMKGLAREITAGPEAVASGPVALVSPRVFWIGLSLAVAALLGLIVRLISSGTARRPSRPGP